MKTLFSSIALAAATASLVVADAAHSARTLAQDWPNRPMTMVAPFAAGIPYRSGGQAMQDLLAARVDYQCPSLPTAMPQIAGKTVKAFAILSKNRSPSIPDLPSAHEQGLTDFDIPSWYALFLPKGTPDAIVRKLHSATVAAMDMPSMQERLNKVGSDLVGSERRSPEYLAQFVGAEIRKWEAPIKSSGVQF